MKQIVSTTEEHILELSKTMRQADKDEVWASNHKNPYDALRQGWLLSPETFTGLLDGHVVCIFGVAQNSLLSEDGVPWLLTSDLIHKAAYTFLRVNKVYVNEIRKKYKKLENYVDCRNKMAIRWLSWLGFEMDKPQPYGPDNVMFRRFEYRRP